MIPPRDIAQGALAALLAAGCLLGVVAGCRGGADRPSKDDRRYTLRGEVVQAPAPGAKRRELTLRHEAIDGFVNEAGAVVGMGAMVMPFDVAPAETLEGLAPGDKVEAVLAVDWSRPSFQLEQLRRLPAGTVLRFEKARPTQAGAQ